MSFTAGIVRQIVEDELGVPCFVQQIPEKQAIPYAWVNLRDVIPVDCLEDADLPPERELLDVELVRDPSNLTLAQQFYKRFTNAGGEINGQRYGGMDVTGQDQDYVARNVAAGIPDNAFIDAFVLTVWVAGG